MLARENPVATF